MREVTLMITAKRSLEERESFRCSEVSMSFAEENLGVESMVLVSSVLNQTGCAVRLHQAVLALHQVAVAGLRRALDVACVHVMDSVLVRVAGGGVLAVGFESTMAIALESQWAGRDG